MNDVTTTIAIPTTIGTAFAGGFYGGTLRVGQELVALIVAPKEPGEHDDTRWNKSVKRIDGAGSFFDGRANTLAMAEAGSALAKWAIGLRMGNYDDWYLPSRDELELVYRYLKPTARENWVFRNGDNPSSVPPGYPYTTDSPGQTAIEAFRSGGPEAFDETWYWTSTQYAGYAEYAWGQYFSDGFQNTYPKDTKLRARAVRRAPF